MVLQDPPDIHACFWIGWNGIRVLNRTGAGIVGCHGKRNIAVEGVKHLAKIPYTAL
jgi:hypothetical protein